MSCSQKMTSVSFFPGRSVRFGGITRRRLTSTLPWMLSIGWDWVGMFSLAEPASVRSLIWSVMIAFLSNLFIIVTW